MIGATKQVTEYRYAPLDYYFITSRDADKSTLDAASGWVRTGASFLVYPTQQTGTRSITRFYFDRVARSDAKVAPHLEGKAIKRVIYVPGRILNIVVA